MTSPQLDTTQLDTTQQDAVRDFRTDLALEAAHDAATAARVAGTPLSALATSDDDDDAADGLDTLTARVVLDGGGEFTVPVLNRDFVAWDMTRGKKKWPPAEEAPFLLNNFLAWTAARRNGHPVPAVFDAFVDAAVVVHLTKGAAARPTQ